MNNTLIVIIIIAIIVAMYMPEFAHYRKERRAQRKRMQWKRFINKQP